MKYYKKILREKSKTSLEENGTNKYKKNGNLDFQGNVICIFL